MPPHVCPSSVLIINPTSLSPTMVVPGLFVQVAEHSLDGIIVFKAVRDDKQEIIDFQYVFVNARAKSLLCRGPNEGLELVGRRLCELFPNHKDDQGLFYIYAEILRSGKPFSGVVCYKGESVDGFYLNRTFRLKCVSLSCSSASYRFNLPFFLGCSCFCAFHCLCLHRMTLRAHPCCSSIFIVSIVLCCFPCCGVSADLSSC